MTTREDEYMPDDTDNTTAVTQVPDTKYTIDEAVEIIGFGRAQWRLAFIKRF